MPTQGMPTQAELDAYEEGFAIAERAYLEKVAGLVAMARRVLAASFADARLDPNWQAKQ